MCQAFGQDGWLQVLFNWPIGSDALAVCSSSEGLSMLVYKVGGTVSLGTYGKGVALL